MKLQKLAFFGVLTAVLIYICWFVSNQPNGAQAKAAEKAYGVFAKFYPDDKQAIMYYFTGHGCYFSLDKGVDVAQVSLQIGPSGLLDMFDEVCLDQEGVPYSIVFRRKSDK